jgi:AbrB family looped-hinge helix DNA binding protein
MLVGMKARVSEKGQVTVPKRLRERLDIRPGDELDFSEEDGRLVALKAPADDPVASVYGTLELERSTDELIRELRGDAGLP